VTGSPRHTVAVPSGNVRPPYAARAGWVGISADGAGIGLGPELDLPPQPSSSVGYPWTEVNVAAWLIDPTAPAHAPTTAVVYLGVESQGLTARTELGRGPGGWVGRVAYPGRCERVFVQPIVTGVRPLAALRWLVTALVAPTWVDGAATYAQRQLDGNTYSPGASS